VPIFTPSLADWCSPGIAPYPDPTANGSLPFVSYPNSIYTTPLPSSPIIAPTSGTIVNNFLNNNAGGPNQGSWSRGASRYVVHGNTMPKVLVSCNQAGKRSWGAAPSGTLMCPIPVGAVSCEWTTDRQMLIIDIDNGLVYEFWVMGGAYPYFGANAPNVFSYPDGTWACNTMICSPTNGTWTGISPWSGDPTGMASQVSAAKISYEGCTITNAEMMYVAHGGTINHIVGGATGNTGFCIPPAAAYDFAYSSVSVPEGAIFTWAPGHVYTATTVLGLAIEHAIGTYGLAIFDSTAGNGFSLAIENPTPWWNYAPGNPLMPYLPGLANWGNNKDNLGNIIMTAGFNWNQLVQVGMRYPGGIVNNDTMPGAPTGLTLSNGTPGSHQITATWTAPASHGTNVLNGYLLFIGTASGVYDPMNLPYTNGGGLTLTTNSSTLTYSTTTRAVGSGGVVVQLVPGTTYYFQVAAISNSGMGTPSTEQSWVCPT
jgi:hypothetical protein